MIPLWKIVCCIFVITIHPLSRVVAQTADNADEQVRRPPASVHRCVHGNFKIIHDVLVNLTVLSNFVATNKVRKAGDGTTANSCMGCRPTKPECSAGCQDLIDNMYLRCDGVCLPNGYFFDPRKFIKPEAILPNNSTLLKMILCRVVIDWLLGGK